MNRTARVLIPVLCFAALTASAMMLSQHGKYGWTLFVMLPVIAGAVGTCAFQPPTPARAIRLGLTIGGIGCALFLVAGVEGLICMAMAIPVVVPLTIAGSLLAYWAGTISDPRRPAAMVLLLPVSLFYDGHATPPVYRVTTSMVVNAAPDRVWKYVATFPDIPTKPDWMLRTGLAYPIRTRIEGSGVGAARKCDLSTGTVEERVVQWTEGRLLRFAVTATPPAMREMGLYGPIYPKHLEGYYISKEGQFELTPLAGGRTLVTGTSWYQHGLWPAAYWRLWSDTVVHHIHQRVLEHIRTLAERDS